MKISIKYTTIKQMLDAGEDESFIKGFASSALYTIKDSETIDESYSANVNLIDFNKKKIKELYELFSKYDVAARTLTAMRVWIDNLNNPSNAVISSLPQLEKILKTIIDSTEVKWIWKENPDGMIVPYEVKEIKYRSRYRDDAASVTLLLICIKYSRERWSDDEEINLKESSESISFYHDDISSNENELIDLYSNDDDESDEEDDDDEKKPKKKRKPKGEFELAKVLSDKGIFLNTAEIYEQYKKQIANWQLLSSKVGSVFCASGKGYSVDDSKNAYGAWRNINADEKTSKLVVDISGEKKTSSTAPIHPYVCTYNLNLYCKCFVHIDNLVPYVFDEKIIDKLVMSKKKKNLLSALIATENNFSDIISGKSGGIIILASGAAGLGKTLTAEVYSELMKKPLYSIQSSQLGINVDDIEKKLNKILYRADKWGAVLLIDEADAYIYKRGDNILQNCIVGTFLRLLEYFNGVLFLTTNRFEAIDDAIMSRITAHIRYEYPDKEESIQLWKVLTENFGLKIEDATIDDLLSYYETMSGRDIRNLLKMILKTSKSKKITLNSVKDLEDFLPFIKYNANAKSL